MSEIFSKIKEFFIPSEGEKILCGALPDKPDKRDYIKEFNTNFTPVSVNLTDNMKFNIMNQGETNSCTGHSAAAFLDILYGKLHRKLNLEFNPYFIYYNARMVAFNTAAKDNGCYLRSVMHSLKNHGACTKPLCDINNTRSKPQEEDYTIAKLFKIKDYIRIPQNNLYKAIQYTLCVEKLPIAISLWYSPRDWQKANSTGLLKRVYPDRKNGGHAVCICGYDVKDDTFITINSWGKSWGKSGFFKIDRKVIENEVIDAWTVSLNYF